MCYGLQHGSRGGGKVGPSDGVGRRAGRSGLAGAGRVVSRVARGSYAGERHRCALLGSLITPPSPGRPGREGGTLDSGRKQGVARTLGRAGVKRRGPPCARATSRPCAAAAGENPRRANSRCQCAALGAVATDRRPRDTPRRVADLRSGAGGPTFTLADQTRLPIIPLSSRIFGGGCRQCPRFGRMDASWASGCATLSTR